MSNHVTVLEIDANAVLHNLAFFKKQLKEETKVMVVVKAFGYGSDAVAMAKIVQDQVAYFAVAYADEGVQLREAGIKVPIMVFYPQVENLEVIVKHRLEPSLYNFRIFDAFAKYADEHVLMNYPVHFKFNTGLNRLGFAHTDVPQILAQVKASNNYVVRSLYTHLAASEDPSEVEFTSSQINNFAYIVKQIYTHLGYEPMIHALNTSGIINYPQAQFDMVRLGIGLFGLANNPEVTKQLKNTHALKSVITQIHFVKPGETVGYNRAFTANKETTIATIPIGHADGVSRKLGNKNGFVFVNGKPVPIIGNVCMDMLMVDVTEVECKQGDKVMLFNHQNHINYIASKCETISYEIIAGISQRVKRIVITE